jgi:long-chain acyl-CoA synthetase
MDFGAGLMTLYDNIIVDKVSSWFMGVFSINRYEWLVADMGACCYSIPNVALYDTLGPETSEFIINHAEVPIIVTSVDKVAGLLSMSKQCPTLKVIIVMDTLFKNEESAVPILEKWGAQLGIKVISFSATLQLGKKNPRPHKPPTGDDLYALSYTSGTTGNPKGVMLTHLNMVSTLRTMATTLMLGPDDAHISYLPLAHIFERVIILGVILNGSSAGFFRGDVALLLEDIAELKPTIFASVPRLFNRIYDKIIQGALHSGSSVKAALFTKALDAKMHYLNTRGTLKHSIWDPLVFNKVKKVLGGRVRYMITASAPISSNVLSFLRVAASAQVCEAYGQTESCGGLTVSWPNDFAQGHVGYVVPHQELKLVSVPDMNYHAKDLKGEVWVRGYGVFKGYFKDKAKTDETLTQDGWLKTGGIFLM